MSLSWGNPKKNIGNQSKKTFQIIQRVQQIGINKGDYYLYHMENKRGLRKFIKSLLNKTKGQNSFLLDNDSTFVNFVIYPIRVVEKQGAIYNYSIVDLIENHLGIKEDFFAKISFRSMCCMAQVDKSWQIFQRSLHRNLNGLSPATLHLFDCIEKHKKKQYVNFFYDKRNPKTFLFEDFLLMSFFTSRKVKKEYHNFFKRNIQEKPINPIKNFFPFNFLFSPNVSQERREKLLWKDIFFQVYPFFFILSLLFLILQRYTHTRYIINSIRTNGHHPNDIFIKIYNYFSRVIPNFLQRHNDNFFIETLSKLRPFLSDISPTIVTDGGSFLLNRSKMLVYYLYVSMTYLAVLNFVIDFLKYIVESLVSYKKGSLLLFSFHNDYVIWLKWHRKIYRKKEMKKIFTTFPSYKKALKTLVYSDKTKQHINLVSSSTSSFWSRNFFNYLQCKRIHQSFYRMVLSKKIINATIQVILFESLFNVFLNGSSWGNLYNPTSASNHQICGKKFTSFLWKDNQSLNNFSIDKQERNIYSSYVAEVSHHDIMLAFFSEIMLVGILGIHLSKKFTLPDKMRLLIHTPAPRAFTLQESVDSFLLGSESLKREEDIFTLALFSQNYFLLQNSLETWSLQASLISNYQELNKNVTSIFFLPKSFLKSYDSFLTRSGEKEFTKPFQLLFYSHKNNSFQMEPYKTYLQESNDGKSKMKIKWKLLQKYQKFLDSSGKKL